MGRLRSYAICGLLVAAGVAVGVLVEIIQPRAPTSRSFAIASEQYGFSPSVLRVNRGDTIRLELTSKDVAHGFYLEGYDIDAHIFPKDEVVLRHPSSGKDYEPANAIEFTADRVGKFRFRCSVTCGNLHPFMLGELVVRPNYLFTGGIGLFAGLVAAAFFRWTRQEHWTAQEAS